MIESEHNYSSHREDRDLILEYNQVDLSDATVENIHGIGIDNVTRAQAVVKVIKMIEKGGRYHIMMLNPYKLMRIKMSNDLSVVANQASMKLASGAGLQWAASMMKRPLKERIPQLSFIMDLVRIAEIKEYSIFIVGGKPEVTERVYTNIRKSFPEIRIVGRHSGFFSADREVSVIEAIRKSQANIILCGLGFPGEEKWIGKVSGEFKNAVFLSVGGNLDIISGEHKKAPAWFMERDLDWFYRIISRPWNLPRLFPVIFFFVSAIAKRLFRKV